MTASRGATLSRNRSDEVFLNSTGFSYNRCIYIWHHVSLSTIQNETRNKRLTCITDVWIEGLKEAQSDM